LKTWRNEISIESASVSAGKAKSIDGGYVSDKPSEEKRRENVMKMKLSFQLHGYNHMPTMQLS